MTLALSSRPEVAVRPPSMVERMTLIMDCFEGPKTRLLLEEVSRRTGLPRSTAHRILDQLVRLQWVEHTRSGYHLGRRVRTWGARESGHSDLRAAAAPWLHELAVMTDLVVHLGTLDETYVEYLDKVGGRRAAAVASRVGGRAPAHCTALGKAMLAWLPPEEIDELYADGVPAATGASVDGLPALHRELGRIRRDRGLAVERGECVEGIACVGVAIRGPEGPVGAISLVAGHASPLERIAPLVYDMAQRITLDLFGESALRTARVGTA
ncbi:MULTISPECIES: IclR family transcriptional regulator [Streptomyces]|nr:pectin degradation repressor protein KdgR [Streptomyces acidiscabies]GAQ63134.1 pectin degradation repressor protein KdgR [Streptomyces scabiei]GAQ76473.1 pectin degradation repressor protein KdgR [Streptomyces turgidiscabies]